MIIIPLREKIGNYDPVSVLCRLNLIIPLREKIGNYDRVYIAGWCNSIIPLREKIGNYDLFIGHPPLLKDYTTTRENWELRPNAKTNERHDDYTTTRENWELRHQNKHEETTLKLYHYERKLGTTTVVVEE